MNLRESDFFSHLFKTFHMSECLKSVDRQTLHLKKSLSISQCVHLVSNTTMINSAAGLMTLPGHVWLM